MWSDRRGRVSAAIDGAFVALAGGKFVILRVSYPMGFHTKALDERSDGLSAGSR
jgi:hypothetical protein